MTRPLRIEYPGAWYHVTCRGNEKRNIFWDDADREKLLGILSANLKLYRIELHSYVLMQTHFHLLLMTPEANLRKFMQRFNTTYTVYFNRRHRRSGHLANIHRKIWRQPCKKFQFLPDSGMRIRSGN